MPVFKYIQAVIVNIKVFVPPVLPGSHQSPESIQQTKTEQPPPGQSAADTFQPGCFGKRPAKRRTTQSQQHRTPHMPAAADDGPGNGPDKTPSPCSCQNDERKIVVRSC